MPDIDKAIAMAQKLRSLLIQVIAVEKERAEYEGSDEATDKEMEDVLSTFKEAVNDEVPAVDGYVVVLRTAGRSRTCASHHVRVRVVLLREV